MKKISISVMALLLLVVVDTTSVMAQRKVALSESAMPLNASSQQAKKLGMMGLTHMMNVERELAYNDFKAAADLDPSFSVALSYLASLSYGQSQKEYARRAMETAKTEGEKLYAQIVQETTTPEARQQAWATLHNMYPNDHVIGYAYAFSRATPDERIAELNAFMQKYPEETAAYNQLGYVYMANKKDMAKAKEYFEKYIQTNPSSANPYDSMGEFYLTTGDLENAEKYYKLALEKYPFMVSSVEGLQKIEASKKKTDKN